MEKYAKLLKGLEKCAGPECCKDGCPYYKTTTGGMTCRARLLMDANIAITNEVARNESAETLLAHIKSLDADIETLEAANNAYRTERDELVAELAALKLIKQEGKTDRPSACDKELMEEVGKLIGQAKYQEGRADTLAAIVERCSFGGGCCHE